MQSKYNPLANFLATAPKFRSQHADTDGCIPFMEFHLRSHLFQMLQIWIYFCGAGRYFITSTFWRKEGINPPFFF